MMSLCGSVFLSHSIINHDFSSEELHSRQFQSYCIVVVVAFFGRMQFYVTSLHSYINNMLTHSLALSLKDLMRSAVDIPLNNNYDYNDFIVIQRII